MDDAELKRLFEEFSAGTRSHAENLAAQVSAETRSHAERLFTELAAEMRRTAEETRRHIDAVAERSDHRFERLVEAVALLDEKVDRRTGDIEQRMEQGFADTQAMIKFSHSDLDRRVRALEES